MHGGMLKINVQVTFSRCYVFFAALFGEGPPERRDRLRKLLSELGNSELQCTCLV